MSDGHPDGVPVGAGPARLAVSVATDFPVRAWQAIAIEALAAVPGVELVAWTSIPAPAAGEGASEPPVAAALRPVATPAALERLHGDGPRPGALATGARGRSSVEVATSRAGLARADVHLALVAREPAASPDAPPSVWRFRYGSDGLLDPGRAAVVSFVRHPGRTRVRLVDERHGTTLLDGWLSWWRGEELDRMLLDTATWPARVAAELLDRASTPAPATDAAAGPPAGPPDRPFASHPRDVATWPEPALRAAAVGRRGWSSIVTATRHEDWNIGLVDAPIQAVALATEPPVISWLPARPGRYAADPFGLVRDGVLHVLFEDFDQRRGRGTISHVAIGPDGAAGEPEPVLDLGVHASYPFLVETAGGTFMLPEASAGGSLRLYEAIEFPRRWRPAATLLPDVPAVDASVVEFQGRWWMFATTRARGANNNLCIWHSPTLTGPWAPHEGNPVKTDSRSARPGGTPFVVDGTLYRPSQDNFAGYGSRLVVNEVTVLTPRRFSEHAVRAIAPPGPPYPHGLHTLSSAGSRTLVDGKRLRFVRQTAALDLERIGRRLRGSTR